MAKGNMKYSKITALILMSIALAGSAFAAEVKPAETKIIDRAYVNDFADKKVSVVYMVNGKEVPATYKEIAGKSVVFVDSTGADLTVERGSATFKFLLKTDKEAMGRARAYLNKGELESAIKELRPMIYPMLPLCALSEQAFASADLLKEFVDALLETGKLKEAYALAKTIPLELLGAENIATVMDIALALAQKGETAKALSIVEKVELKDEAQYSASDSVLKVLSVLRNAGMIKKVLPVYSKFSATSNPQANEFKLWSIYCDIALGNKMSAEVYLSAIKVERTNDAFSLLKMVQGDLLANHPKKPDISAALDAYAEGIVFGKISNEWMPELLYKTGMAYKTQQNFVASNEVFAQIIAMYEGDAYAEKGKKEIVKIEQKKVEKDVSHESDDEDEDDDF